MKHITQTYSKEPLKIYPAAVECPVKMVYRVLNRVVLSNEIDELIVYDRSRTDKLVHLRITLPFELGNIRFRFLNGILGPCGDSPADIPHCFQPCHFVADGRLACKEVGLVSPETLSVHGKGLGEGLKL